MKDDRGIIPFSKYQRTPPPPDDHRPEPPENVGLTIEGTPAVIFSMGVSIALVVIAVAVAVAISCLGGP